MHAHSLAPYIEHLSHLSAWGIAFAIVASGHLVPVPESAVIILLGYVAAIGNASLLEVIVVAALSAFVLDSIIFYLSREGSQLAHYLSKKIDTSLVDRYQNAKDLDIFSFILVSHFIPGLRFANPIVMGLTGMPPKKFLPFTLLACFIYVPIYAALGYIFHDKVLVLVTAIGALGKVALITIGAVILVGVAIYVVRAGQKKGL